MAPSRSLSHTAEKNCYTGLSEYTQMIALQICCHAANMGYFENKNSANCSSHVKFVVCNLMYHLPNLRTILVSARFALVSFLSE